MNKSTIPGVQLGLFADQFIAKGTTIWAFDPGFDVLITREAFNALPPLSKEFIKKVGFSTRERNAMIAFSCDDERQVNHSENPNVVPFDSEWLSHTVAARDIEAGEELMENYNHYDYGFCSSFLHEAKNGV